MSVFNKKIVKFKNTSDNRVSKANNDEGCEDNDESDIRNKQILNINSKILKKNLNFSAISEFGDDKKHFSAKVLPPIKKISNDSVNNEIPKNHRTNYVLPEIKITCIPEELNNESSKEDNFSFFKNQNKIKLKKKKSKNKSSLAFYSNSELPELKSDFKFNSSAKLAGNELIKSKEILLSTIENIENLQNELENKSKGIPIKLSKKYSSQLNSTNNKFSSTNLNFIENHIKENKIKISSINEFDDFYKDLNKQIDNIDFSSKGKMKKKNNTNINFTKNTKNNDSQIANSNNKLRNSSHKPLAISNKQIPFISNKLILNVSTDKKIKSKFSNKLITENFDKERINSTKNINKDDEDRNIRYKKLSNNRILRNVKESEYNNKSEKKKEINNDEINQSSLKANYKLKLSKKLRKSNSFNSECSSSSNSRNLDDFSQTNEFDLSYKKSLENKDKMNENNRHKIDKIYQNDSKNIFNSKNDIINEPLNAMNNNDNKENDKIPNKVYYRKIHKK